jgi:dTDP-4-dehydrorhamnose reductase
MGESNRFAPWLMTGMGGVLGLGAAKQPPQAIHFIAGLRRPKAWAVTPAVRVNLAQAGALQRVIAELRPAIEVHAASVSRAAECELQKQQAQAINVTAVQELMASAAVAGSFVLYVSTEQVFDGTATRYFESSPVAPRTVYGATKAAAEELVLAGGGAVVRLPLLLGGRVSPSRMGADSAVVAAAARGQRLKLFTDEIRCPVHVDFVAPVLWRIARERLGGVFHLAGGSAVSRFELGVQACLAAGVEPHFDPSLASEFQGPPRSLSLVLDCQRAIKELGWKPPDLRQSLARTFSTSLEVGGLSPD